MNRLVDYEKFYSRLGSTFQPGVITTVVLAAFDLVKQGKKIISMTGGSYDVPSMPITEVKSIFTEASSAGSWPGGPCPGWRGSGKPP